MASYSPIPNQRMIGIEAQLAEIAAKLGLLFQPGDMKLWPFRTASLPFGWYHGNGDKYAEATPQGLALAALPELYKADWGITLVGGWINLPSFYDEEGNGLFPRPADGAERLPGSVQDDAIVNITGSNGTLSMVMKGIDNFYISGPYSKRYTHSYSYTFLTGAASYSDFCAVDFDASLQVNTASEVRPKNVGLTPAVYLGV